MTLNKPLFSSASDNWSTPNDFYEKLNQEFHFTLDPCASSDNHKTEKYFDIGIDGLKQEWHGTVFCNPPYSNIKEWVKKAYEESEKDYCKRVVLLIPSRTDTKYYHDYCSKACQIRFLKGRLKFGDSKNSAPFPSAVVIFNKKIMSDLKPGIFFWDWKNETR